MRQDDETQTRLYKEYWQPIEVMFGSRYGTDFDKFIRDYLTLQLRLSTQIRSEDTYPQFRSYYFGANANTKLPKILDDLKRFAGYYVAFNHGQEEESKLREGLRRLRVLLDVAAPVVMTLYECHKRHKTLTLPHFTEAVEVLESYVFRRSVCDMQTRSLGQIFALLASRIDTKDPFQSLKIALARQGESRRFPTNAEFKAALETRDIYHMRNRHYFLDRLENDSKEKINTSKFTVEHVLPQNAKLRPEWQKMLGSNWKETQREWLNRLGNVTLTGYNSEYSDRPFSDKKSILV